MKQGKLFGEDEEKKLSIKTGLDYELAEDIANGVKSAVKSFCDIIEPVGSLRRQRNVINDIDFIVLTLTDSDWRSIRMTMENSLSATIDPKCAKGNEILRTFVPIRSNISFTYWVQVDFYRTTINTYGILKLIRTGSAEHNVWLAKLAIKKGMRLLYSQGLTKDGIVIAGSKEEDVLEKLGLHWIPPECREIVDGIPVWLKMKKHT